MGVCVFRWVCGYPSIPSSVVDEVRLIDRSIDRSIEDSPPTPYRFDHSANILSFHGPCWRRAWAWAACTGCPGAAPASTTAAVVPSAALLMPAVAAAPVSAPGLLAANTAWCLRCGTCLCLCGVWWGRDVSSSTMSVGDVCVCVSSGKRFGRVVLLPSRGALKRAEK
jgi:hypothetical protein